MTITAPGIGEHVDIPDDAGYRVEGVSTPQGVGFLLWLPNRSILENDRMLHRPAPLGSFADALAEIALLRDREKRRVVREPDEQLDAALRLPENVHPAHYTTKLFEPAPLRLSERIRLARAQRRAEREAHFYGF